MKKVLLSIPLVLLLFAACRKTSNPAVFDLGVDIQSSFDQDNVQVFIDNQPLLNSPLSSSPLLGLATSISTANTEGYHTIKVVINDNIVKTESFMQSNDLYIGVNYNRSTKAISLIYSDHGFMYY
jgi:hypothetical protein